MVKALVKLEGGAELVVLGLDDENLRRMRAGQPVYVPLVEITPRGAGVGVVLMHGTPGEVRAELESFAGPARRESRDPFLTRADALDALYKAARGVEGLPGVVADAVAHVAEFDLSERGG